MSTSIASRYVWRSAFLVTLLAGSNAVSGCGSDSSSSSGGYGGYAGYGLGGFGLGGGGGVAGGGVTGGATSFGGLPGAGGFATTGSGGGSAGGMLAAGGAAGAGTAGSTGAGGAESPDASIEPDGGTTPTDGGADGPECLPPDPLLDLSAGKPCDKTKFPLCTNGICMPNAFVPADAKKDLGDCDADNKCVPLFIGERANQFYAPKCVSVNGAEGRCLSACIPKIAEQASFLQRGTCDAGDLCAPCFDPRTGEDTTACHQGCDRGPTEDPKLFPKCCGNRGSCVPTNIVPPADAAQLDKGTCSGSGVLCAPDNLGSPGFIPAKCTSLAGAEGRCLPDCVPQVSQQASRLPKDVCATGELCAPCFDPVTGLDTAACTRNGDKPSKDPVVFDRCCKNLGSCVPTAILTSDQRSQLGTDPACGANTLCAPDVFTIAGQKPAVCRALSKVGLNAEGRCIPSCVPSVAAQASQLDKATCPTDMLCAPCYDPITGAATAACTQNGDKPQEAKVVFPTCCGSAGVCVPKTSVPPAQVSQLDGTGCTGTDILCAPKAFTDPTAKPAACTAPGNVEGRCLPDCLPTVQSQKQNLRQVTCKTGELCAPCYNPLDGTTTGACSVNGDAPTKTKVVYDKCCPYNSVNRSTCVPKELLSASQQTTVPQLTCAAGFLCAPNLKVQNQSAKFPTCKIPNPILPGVVPDDPGGCVPDCMITDAVQKALLAQRTCAAGELCAPCTNPLTGATTGACD